MATFWKKWCLNECGKTVSYNYHPKDPAPYICSKCNQKFSKEELEK